MGWIKKQHTVQTASASILACAVLLLANSIHPQQAPSPAPTKPTPTNPATSQPPVNTSSGLQPSPDVGQAAESSQPSPTASSAVTPTKSSGAPVLATALPDGMTLRDVTRQYVLADNTQYPLREYEPLLTPNDPLANQAWVTNAKLNQAWDTVPGNHETLLAIIDTGFGLQHEEFANRWYTNPGETGPASAEQPSRLNCTGRGLPLNADCNLIDENGDSIVDNESGSTAYQNPSRLNCTDQAKPLAKDCNQLDDDGNGYIDDLSGWDFANYDNSPQAGELNPTGTGTSHGTIVAGVAAATGGNGKGLAGVNWQTKILPIQALDDDSYGDTLGVGRAIRYAAARGADVISLSLGSTEPDSYVRESIRLATAAGSVVVASSGNNGCDCMSYPANYPEVVSVGALNTSNQPASFSSYGTNLDILAPGTQFTSANWTSANRTSAYISNMQGTSLAAPVVSGLLARLLSQQPTATPLQLIASLTESTNRLTLPLTTPRTAQFGYGAVDATKATSRMNTAQNLPHGYSFTPISKGTFLNQAIPAEAQASYAVKACEANQPGSTPLYEMTKSGSAFFTISQVEVWQAQRNGYQARLFTEACLQQPHDVLGIIRSLNVYKEFLNIYDER